MVRWHPAASSSTHGDLPLLQCCRRDGGAGAVDGEVGAARRRAARVRAAGEGVPCAAVDALGRLLRVRRWRHGVRRPRARRRRAAARAALLRAPCLHAPSAAPRRGDGRARGEGQHCSQFRSVPRSPARPSVTNVKRRRTKVRDLNSFPFGIDRFQYKLT